MYRPPERPGAARTAPYSERATHFTPIHTKNHKSNVT
jgi:hypothetical protein